MKATTNKIERSPIEWEKILASDTYDNGLIYAPQKNVLGAQITQ